MLFRVGLCCLDAGCFSNEVLDQIQSGRKVKLAVQIWRWVNKLCLI